KLGEVVGGGKLETCRHTPAPRKSARRLELEALEDRLTPSFGLFFHPYAPIAVNPQPLPPGGSIEFTPQPIFSQIVDSLPAETTEMPLNLQGSSIQASTDPIVTLVSYQLSGQVQETQGPSPVAGDLSAISANWNLNGMVSETVFNLGSTIPLWTMHGNVNLTGKLDGTVRHSSTST